MSSRRRKPTGRRRPIKVLLLDGRPAPSGPVARRRTLVVPRSQSVGLRLRLLTWCPYGASRAQVFQQARKPQVHDEKTHNPSPGGAAEASTKLRRLLGVDGVFQQPARLERGAICRPPAPFPPTPCSPSTHRGSNPIPLEVTHPNAIMRPRSARSRAATGNHPQVSTDKTDRGKMNAAAERRPP